MIEDMTRGHLYLDSTARRITQKGLESSSAWVVPPGAVLISMYATIGATAVTSIPLATNQAILAVQVKDGHCAEFLAYAVRYYKHLLTMRTVESTQKNVNKATVSDFALPVPPLPEQRRIAALLFTVQRAIEQQEKLIALTAELKKALMHKLFSEGTRGEPQKETEIGLIPESWEVAKLGEVAESFTYGTSTKCDYDLRGTPVLRIPNVVGGHVDVGDLKCGVLRPGEIANLSLRGGDLLFVRTNGVQENAGRCSMYRGELGEDCCFASYLIRVRVRQEALVPEFLEEYSRTVAGASFLAGKASRTADGKFNINTGTLKNVLVPAPGLAEQELITGILESVDNQSTSHLSLLGSSRSLFRTLLHRLMTAQLRVDEVDMSEIEAIGVYVSDVAEAATLLAGGRT